MSDFIRVSHANFSITVKNSVMSANYAAKARQKNSIYSQYCRNDSRTHKRHRCQLGDKLVSLDKGQKNTYLRAPYNY